MWNHLSTRQLTGLGLTGYKRILSKNHSGENQMSYVETNESLGDSGTALIEETTSERGRRRKIDPTTCERDYSNDEREFMQALEEYKRQNGRNFPTCSEILEVIRGLGYIR
jgi:hypothetical protein